MMPIVIPPIPPSLEQKVIALEKRLDRLALTVDGDVLIATPSLRAEILALRRELRSLTNELVKQRQSMQSFHHDLETYYIAMSGTEDKVNDLTAATDDHARRDIWIHSAQFIIMAIMITLLVVVILSVAIQ